MSHDERAGAQPQRLRDAGVHVGHPVQLLLCEVRTAATTAATTAVCCGAYGLDLLQHRLHGSWVAHQEENQPEDRGHGVAHRGPHHGELEGHGVVRVAERVEVLEALLDEVAVVSALVLAHCAIEQLARLSRGLGVGHLGERVSKGLFVTYSI